MTVFTKTAVDIFAANDASGAARKVANHDVQVWGTEVERALAAFQAGGGVVFDSKDQADANLGYDANTMAWVFDDDPSLVGIYQKQGASGSGSWQRVGDLPYSFILATNTNSGNPNAIEATTAIPIPTADGGALIALPIVADNTASPVTISFNGETPLTIKTASGNDIAPGGLTQNMIVWGYKQGANFRLATDQASAAIQAAAEDAADRAQSYAAMLSADKVKFKTVPLLLADETMSYTPGSGLIEVGPGDIIEAQGFRYEVAASDAEDSHVETAGGVKLDAVAATVLDPRQFGIPHESADVEYVTQQWQKLLDFAGGAWIDGGGRLYEIDRIFGHSHQRIRNVRFLKTASDQDSNAALTFESEKWESGPTPPEPLRDIVLEDVEVDGNRDFQTNILAAEENGGRHGIAFYGRIHDVTLRRVHSHHCATDGVIFWSGYRRNPVYEDRDDNDFCFRDIVLDSCRFTWNGRCGYSLDSVINFTSINGKYNDNGRDTKDTDPLDLDGGNRSSYGSRARRFNGGPFGRGFFWEDYGLGSSFANILSIGDQCHRNAQGFLIHSALLADDWQLPGYSPRGPFKVIDIDIDEALNVSEHGQPLSNYPAISVYAQNSNQNLVPFRDIRISGRIEGQILLRGVNGFNFDGKMKLSTNYFAKVIVRDVSNATFNMNESGAGVIANVLGDPIWYHPTISGGANTTNITSTTPREIDISGPYVLKYSIRATAVSNGIVSLTFSPPAGHDVEVLSASAADFSTGAAIAASIADETVAVQNATSGQVISFTVTVAVRLS